MMPHVWTYRYKGHVIQLSQVHGQWIAFAWHGTKARQFRAKCALRALKGLARSLP